MRLWKIYLVSAFTNFHRRTIPAQYKMWYPVSLHIVIILLYRKCISPDIKFHLEIHPVLKEITDIFINSEYHKNETSIMKSYFYHSINDIHGPQHEKTI